MERHPDGVEVCSSDGRDSAERWYFPYPLGGAVVGNCYSGRSILQSTVAKAL